ncbi:MAG: hypothetical protein M3252_04425 [Actinomycetota bacterium]|nr:hypothetical protein [Actinomycetota bacterium]
MVRTDDDVASRSGACLVGEGTLPKVPPPGDDVRADPALRQGERLLGDAPACAAKLGRDQRTGVGISGGAGGAGAYLACEPAGECQRQFSIERAALDDRFLGQGLTWRGAAARRVVVRLEGCGRSPGRLSVGSAG